MKLTNNEICNYANALSQEFGTSASIKLPIKVNFFLQKNIKALVEAATDIENSRIAIAQEYGVLNEDGESYQIPPEKIEDASKELNDLFNLEQDIPIKNVNLEDFNNIELTTAQMSALLFMIKDEPIEDE